MTLSIGKYKLYLLYSKSTSGINSSTIINVGCVFSYPQRNDDKFNKKKSAFFLKIIKHENGLKIGVFKKNAGFAKSSVTMGNKIITEKDFWMCSSGAVPAQLQGTRKSNKKESGEVYITVADTATSSWIDFGCTKNMLINALIAAVVVIVIVVAVVATGGMAAVGLMGMMAIGAGAGVIAGIVTAVDGALKCGQKNATQRTWDSSKQNLIFTGVPAITGDRTMTCKIGGVVKFAPEVKSWSHAIGLAGLNYLTKFAECALGGAAVGGGGFLLSGLATGSLALAMPTAGSIATNVATSFTGIWGGSRLLFGADHLANEHAYGNVNGTTDALTTFGSGAVPEVGMGQRIATGQAQPSDYLLFLYLLNVKARGSKPPVAEEPQPTGDKDGNSTGDKDDTQPKEESVASSKGQAADEAASVNNKKGEAFEDGTSTVYRTQGGVLPNASRHRVIIDEFGNIKIEGDSMLYVTIDDAAHQVYFYDKRGGAARGAEIASFKIPEALANEIKANGVPQDLGRANPGKPQISDPTKSTGAYGLPKEYIQKLQDQAIQGTGKIEKP